MKICILSSGSAGMYCGSCMRDNALASALMRMKHEVTLIPLHTPTRTDVKDVSEKHVYLGGINVYLQHASKVFRHLPKPFRWMLDRPWVLNWAGQYGSKKQYSELGDLTLDLLRGSDGMAIEEIRRLADFIRDTLKPDVVSLPNLMFMGVARIFREELKIPVICELTGEDIFLDALSPADRKSARELILQQVPYVNQFVATSYSYAGKMAGYLNLPVEKIRIVYPGLPKEFLESVAVEKQTISAIASAIRPRTVGYMARICPEKGIDKLIDAMLNLRETQGFSDVQLQCAGYLGKRDVEFFEKLQRKVSLSSMRGSVHFLGEVDQEQKINLLLSSDVFCVPTVYEESKGIYVLEALACGVPVVQPAHGSFPELLQATQGGLTVRPGDAVGLAKSLAELLNDPDRSKAIGQNAATIVHEKFTDVQMAENMLKIYNEARG